ncbi:uncharacterized protein LOC104005083 [Pan troglodytes]|nr:uncharacterized protein LOC104005083 [Pan troglodytes]
MCVCLYLHMCLCVCMCVCTRVRACGIAFLFLSSLPLAWVLLVSHWSYEGEGVVSLCLSYPHCPECRAAMYIWRWGGQGAVPLQGECRAWGGPSPAPRAVNVFRVGGGRWSLLCVWGEGWVGPPTWPRGSVVFYTCLLPVQGWERLCEGREGRGWACCGQWHTLFQP